MKKIDMEKIIEAVKQLIQPKEKEGNHLDLHVQINKLFQLVSEELKNKDSQIKELSEKIDFIQEGINTQVKTMKEAVASVGDIINKNKETLVDFVNKKITKDHFLVKFEWLVSTQTNILFSLDDIEVNEKWKYRLEISKTRKAKKNENVKTVKMQTLEVFEGKFTPTIYLESKWWMAILEYDFDILVTKL